MKKTISSTSSWTATSCMWEPALLDDRIRLTDWFSMLAAQWSGWDEEFTWDSDEGEFSLTARHDRVGRVFITAKFTPHWGAWQAEATLDIAPGDLEGITRKLMTFAKAGAKD